MKILYTGIFKEDYSRNEGIITGLRELGHQVILANNRHVGKLKYWNLYKSIKSLSKDVDFVLIGFPGQTSTIIARLATRKPIVLDLFVSYYDAIILERKQFGQNTFKSIYFYFLDWLSCKLADKILIDTKTHGKYISKLVHVPESKIATIYTGAGTNIFQPEISKKERDYTLLSYHGNIQNINGFPILLRALKLLKDTNWKMKVVGGGSVLEEQIRLAKDLGIDAKVEFIGPKPKIELAEIIKEADIGFGFFSNSPKLNRVIANKIYEQMASKIPIITGESEAISEIFKNNKDILYCKNEDPQDLANAIQKLILDKDAQNRLKENAYRKVTEIYTTKYIGEQIMTQLPIM